MKRLPDKFPFAWGKQVLDQYLKLRPFYYGDYYRLTPYSKTLTEWMAWQVDRDDLGEGRVQIFRRDKSESKSATIRFRGLQPDARYTLTDLDAARTKEMTGREFLDSGLPITIKDRPDAVIATYKKKPCPDRDRRAPAWRQS